MIRTGDIIEFGHYPTLIDETVRPIKWQCIKTGEEQVMFIASYCMNAKRFDTQVNIWKDSHLFRWLNTQFVNDAFTDQEKIYIRRVTCPSMEDMYELFEDDQSRAARATSYAKQCGASVDEHGFSWYWTKSEGDEGKAVIVSNDGSIDEEGFAIGIRCAVRPVLIVSSDMPLDERIVGHYEPDISYVKDEPQRILAADAAGVKNEAEGEAAKEEAGKGQAQETPNTGTEAVRVVEKVVEKIVEKVVEKPVEVVKIVEKPVEVEKIVVKEELPVPELFRRLYAGVGEAGGLSLLTEAMKTLTYQLRKEEPDKETVYAALTDLKHNAAWLLSLMKEEDGDKA